MMPKIALFFTEGAALKTWHDAGLIRRDTALYEALCQQGFEVSFVTYGKPNDAQYLPEHSQIKVLPRPEGMPIRDYAWNIHRIHHEALSGVDVIKAHQIQGARFAAWTAFKLKKPYLARCGYLKSLFLAQENAKLETKIRNGLEEFFSFHAAKAYCVPSQSEIDYLHRRYRVSRQKGHACPNWIDTERFKPDPTIQKNTRQVCFVARFHPQKQPLRFLEAVKDIPNIDIVMIGGGEMKEQVQAKINAEGLTVTLLDRVDNDNLPRYYNQSAVYVLPTRYEGGSPKSLLEAMACGVPVVSTDGFGVREAFQDGVHGVQCGVEDVHAIREGIIHLLDHPQKAQDMGAKARQHIIQNYSLERALSHEIELIESLCR